MLLLRTWTTVAASLAIGAAAIGQQYTYRSPSIKALNGVRFQWKLTNGWRLVTPAESSVYKANKMPFTLQRLEPQSHRMRKVDGILWFLGGPAKPVAKGSAIRSVPLWGTDKVLWAMIPAADKAYWAEVLKGISYVQSNRK